uniref:DUF7627 domain-containing protein n=1 Tax=Angiostrongylus cantonensis TaxID=6313 RepID=A0A0K0DJZ4_ANGCA
MTLLMSLRQYDLSVISIANFLALFSERSISECAFLARMTENEWKTMCKSLINTALTDGETNFVVDLFIPLMGMFGIKLELMTLCASFVMDGPNGIGNIPALLSAILCANWPRHLSKAIDTINPILYTSVFIIKGWLLVLQEDNEAVRKAENSSSFQDQKKGDSSSTAQKREDPEVVNRCAHTLCLLCESAQRSLWMKWPELCNEIYSIIKPSITHNHAITGLVEPCAGWNQHRTRNEQLHYRHAAGLFSLFNFYVIGLCHFPFRPIGKIYDGFITD